MSFEEGLNLFKAGDYETALTIFEEITGSDLQNHKAWNALGVTYSKLGRTEDAGLCFDNALKIKPGAQVYLRNKEVNEKKLPVIPKEEPKSLPHFSDPKKKLNKKMLVFSGIIVLIFILGIAVFSYLSSGPSLIGSKEQNPVQNTNLIKPSETVGISDAQRYNNSITKGINEMKGNLPGDAVNSFEEGIRLNSQDPRAYTGKGYALIDQGKYPDAVRTFNTAIKLDPGNQDAQKGKEIAIVAGGSSTS